MEWESGDKYSDQIYTKRGLIWTRNIYGMGK